MKAARYGVLGGCSKARLGRSPVGARAASPSSSWVGRHLCSLSPDLDPGGGHRLLRFKGEVQSRKEALLKMKGSVSVGAKGGWLGIPSKTLQLPPFPSSKSSHENHVAGGPSRLSEDRSHPLVQPGEDFLASWVPARGPGGQ